MAKQHAQDNVFGNHNQMILMLNMVGAVLRFVGSLFNMVGNLT